MRYQFTTTLTIDGTEWQVRSNRNLADRPADTRWITRCIKDGDTNGYGTSWDNDRQVVDWYATSPDAAICNCTNPYCQA